MKSINTFMVILFCSISFANTDKYRLLLRGDPATSITIAWNQISGDDALVYYGETDYETDFSLYDNIGQISRSTNYRGMYNKFVRLTNLQPNTSYYFVIKDNNSSSKRFWFKTAPSDKSRLSFIAGGDSRNNREPRQRANTLVSKLKPHAVLFGGDMTNRDTDDEWKEWMDDWQLTTSADGRMIPIVAARGNHENASVIYELFDSPQSQSYFALTFGDDLYRFYTLNTLIAVGGTQKSWLEQDLKENSHAIWKSAQYHFPMRPHTSGKFENIFVYDAWAQTFYENDVRLVVECDSHMVKTTYPVKPSSGYSDNDGFDIDKLNGTVYTGEGCWGAPLRSDDDDKAWTQSSGRFNQFKLIFVDEDKIELRTIKVDNAYAVKEVSNDDVFTLPSNLDVWEMNDPKQTSVVYIYKNIEANFSKQMPNIFDDRTFDISINFTSNVSSVKEVKYSVINRETQLVSNLGKTTNVLSPYSATVPESASYRLLAEIVRSDGESLLIEKDIFVGDFSTENELYILTGSNDITEQEDGDIIIDEQELYLGYRFSGGKESIGLRYENIIIPKNAVVDFAYILFTPSRNKSEIGQGLIQIEDTPNSLPFKEENAELRSKLKATEEQIWRIPQWTKDVIDEGTKTPNLNGLVQSIIDKDDWKQGNAITFSIAPKGLTLENNAANKAAYSYENDPNKSPKLIYGYSFKSSDWSATATVFPGIGVNTTAPFTPLDVNGLMRSSVRNLEGALYECSFSIEGSIGYDKLDKTLKVCTDKDNVYQWSIIRL